MIPTVSLREIGVLRGASNKFLFCTGIWNYHRLSKIQYVIAIHLMRWRTNFYYFSYSSNWNTPPLKPDCHNWWISKIQSDTLEERYAIKFCFKHGKNDATETYGILQTAFGASCMNRASVFEWHKRFKEGRESVIDDESCGRSKEVITPELIGQRVRVTMLRF